MSNFKMSLLVLALVAVISGAAPVFADDSNTYINGSAGWQRFDSVRQLQADSDSLITLGLERRYSNGWGAGIFWIDSSPARQDGTGDTALTQYGIDALHYYQLNENIMDGRIEPYSAIGLGHAEFKNAVSTETETQLRAGLGLRMRLNGYWSAKADVRLIYNEATSELDDTLTFGLSYVFNNQNEKVEPADTDNGTGNDTDNGTDNGTDNDTDNDSVIDANDNCPATPVAVKVDLTGCALDTDGDDVPNYADSCANTPAGITTDSKGCALDSDNDGVSDYKDSCLSSLPGSQVDAVGCGLDSDDDGVTDDKDNCPTTPADVVVGEKGCALDLDSDGVVNDMDNCPATPSGAVIDANGCKFVLEINFATDSAVITQDYYAEIENLANVLKNNGEVNVVIEGHADGSGLGAFNINLARERAVAVMTVLVENLGVGVDRVSAVGYAESSPIAANDTVAGRQVNRRATAVFTVDVAD
jgi:OOP family OmpA-OmpF porin